METRKVKLDNGDVVEVGKLPLKKYADLFAKLDKFPTYLSELEGLDNDQAFTKLPALIVTALPDFYNLVEVATGYESEKVESLGLSELIDLVVAVWEVNKFSDAFSKIKKLRAQGESKN